MIETLSPADAARQLQWLIAMGADEVMSPDPINRFEERQAAKAAAKPAMAQTRAAAAPLPSDAPHKAPDAASAQNLAELTVLLSNFAEHPLRRTATNTCLHGGLETAPLLILADRPRDEEDKSGQVFAAKHQALLARMLAAIGINEGDIAHLNLLPWRPPGNRPPTDAEIETILPFTRRAIQLISPRMILAMGALPALWLGKGSGSIAALRGKWTEVEGVPMLTTFHPETLLKSPASKKLAWHDLLALQGRLR